MSRGSRAAAGVFVAAALLAGCTGPAAAPTSSNVAVSPSAAAPSAPSSPGASGSASARFGTTHRWPDGLSITVGKPSSFWPSGWVREVNAFQHFVVLKLTIANRTGARVDLTGLTLEGRSAGRASDSVHDPGKVGPGAPAKVRKGQKVTFQVALGVKKPKDVQLHVTVDAGREPVVFHR